MDGRCCYRTASAPDGPAQIDRAILLASAIDHQHPRLARQHALEPRVVPALLSGRPLAPLPCAKHQQPPHVALPRLRGLPENLSAAGRALAATEPSHAAKSRPAFEDLHRRREGLDRHGGDRPHARHSLQSPRHRPALGFVGGSLFEYGDLVRQPINLVEIDARELDDENWQGLFRVFDRLCEHRQLRQTLWGHDPDVRPDGRARR